jgi:uncharacterized protein
MKITIRQIRLISLVIILISYVGCREAVKRTSGHNFDADLIDAACKGDLNNVKTYLTLGADVNAKFPDGMTALLAAEACGYPVSPNAEAIVRYLIEKGADVNLRHNDGRTPLIVAAKHGHNESIRALMGRGADVNAKDKEGQTALMNAVALGCNIESLEILVKAGADINARNKKGESVLEQAKSSRACPDMGIVQWLINKGAK